VTNEPVEKVDFLKNACPVGWKIRNYHLLSLKLSVLPEEGDSEKILPFGEG